MLKNYITIAWRNLRKHSFYSLINIVGLAIGVSASLVISLFVLDELSYDSYNEKADRRSWEAMKDLFAEILK